MSLMEYLKKHIDLGLGIGAGNSSQEERIFHQGELLKTLEQVYGGRSPESYFRRETLVMNIIVTGWTRKRGIAVKKSNGLHSESDLELRH